jgi:beta-lactamase regulating signal transducer with metallopeptidase domain
MLAWMGFDSGLVTLLLNVVLIKGTVILLLAGLVARLLRGSSAATRHTVWAAAVCVLAILPLLSSAWSHRPMSGLHLVVAPSASSQSVPPVAHGQAASPEPSAQGTERFGAVLTARANTVTRNWHLGPTSRTSLFVVAGVLGLLWLSVLLTNLSRIGLHLIRIQGLSGRARDHSGTELGRLTDSLSGQLRIRARVRVLVSDETSVPLTWGMRRPVVVLPAAATSWDEHRLRAVLLHELAHVARRDYLLHMLVHAVEALYWLNPLTRIASRRLSVERERACDDFVLRAGTGSCEYAEHLLAVASSIRGEPSLSAVSLAMARRSTLATRVKDVLDRSRDRRPPSMPLFVFAVLAVTFASLTIGPVDLVGVSRLERDSAESLGRALGDLDDPDASIRRHAAWTLGELEACIAVDRLYPLLHDPDPQVRGTAVWALGEIKDPGSIKHLAESLRDPDPIVREIAVLSLGEIERSSAIEHLEDVVTVHEDLLGPALWALGEIGSREASMVRDRMLEARRLWRPWQNDEVWAGHLEEIPMPSPSSITSLLAQLSDPDPQVRRTAAQGLGCLDVHVAVEPLLDALRDPDPGVRAMAVWALDEINPTKIG